jgi:hypothetical protein
MSHRPEDRYEFVAKRTILVGNVAGFQAGDPVPESTVESMGLLESDDVCRRDEWEGLPEDEPARALKRGEMPPHLQSTGKAEPSAADAAGKDSETPSDKDAGTSGRTRKPSGSKAGS